MKKNGFVSDWSINEYYRENNRYGGADVIEAMEKGFFENSKNIIRILEINHLEDEEQILDIYFSTVATFLYQLLNDKGINIYHKKII